MSGARRRRASGAGFIGAAARAALLIVAVGAVGYGGIEFARSPMFALERLDVRGTMRADPADVREVASVARGTNVWLVDVWAVERRAEGLPWVARAAVVRGWPNRFAIVVAERRPAARMSLPGEGGRRVALVDSQGRVLSVGAPEARDQGLVELAVAPAPAGIDVPGTTLDEAVSLGLQGAERLRELGLNVMAVDVRPATGVVAKIAAPRTAGTTTVVFGTLDDLRNKVRTFAAIVAHIERPSDVAYVDVRSVRAPTVMYK